MQWTIPPSSCASADLIQEQGGETNLLVLYDLPQWGDQEKARGKQTAFFIKTTEGFSLFHCDAQRTEPKTARKEQ